MLPYFDMLICPKYKECLSSPECSHGVPHEHPIGECTKRPCSISQFGYVDITCKEYFLVKMEEIVNDNM
jgi:hypothetical protein